MAEHLVRRRPHSRRTPSGRTTYVSAAWVPVRSSGEKKPKQRRLRPCPICGAPMLTVRMQRGGFVHFNGTEGLTRTKHFCMHLGEGLGRRRGEDMDDLFDAS